MGTPLAQNQLRGEGREMVANVGEEMVQIEMCVPDPLACVFPSLQICCKGHEEKCVVMLIMKYQMSRFCDRSVQNVASSYSAEGRPSLR
jgi:hypothetical protein